MKVQWNPDILWLCWLLVLSVIGNGLLGATHTLIVDRHGLHHDRLRGGVFDHCGHGGSLFGTGHFRLIVRIPTSCQSHVMRVAEALCYEFLLQTPDLLCRREQFLVRIHQFAQSIDLEIDPVSLWVRLERGPVFAFQVHWKVLVDIAQVLLDLATHLLEVFAQVIFILKFRLFCLLHSQLILPFHIYLMLLHMRYQVLGGR